ncbi:MAG: preprotein translocase subunit YajC [Candidatus Krumholzibacteriota bacterium]|nr:preprotein translocase subunit YajC [Candidatus Krumholzibacteriota bacterium]
MWPTWGFLIAMFAIFYFLIIRPQQKRSKEHKSMLESLSKGDKVVTTGGILGTIIGVRDHVVTLRIEENTKIEVLLSNIAGKRE